jgi:hypothetical protein
MSKKQKEAILLILQKSGPLSTASIKERVLEKLGEDDSEYPRSTFLNHLNQLVDDLKIQFRIQDNKRIYYIENYTHPVSGGLIIEGYNGRIHVPKVLNSFSPIVSHSLQAEIEKYKMSFNFLLDGTMFSLSIDRDAYPFNLHLSRKTSATLIHEEVVKKFGPRTIVLELIYTKLSSFKDDTHTGHCLISVNSQDTVEIKDLNATNPCEVIEISPNELECLYSETTKINQTINAEWMRTNILSRDFVILKDSKLAKQTIPSLVVLNMDSFIIIN